jgi:hypothetical protein
MTSNPHDNQPGPRPPGHQQTNIQIDRVHYRVLTDTMSGQQLRQLVVPPIPMDRDLFRVVPAGDDVKIDLDTMVALRDGMRFFTAPARINPGVRRRHNGAHD